MGKALLLVSVWLLVLLLGACTPRVAPAPAPQAPAVQRSSPIPSTAAPPAAPAPPAKTAWEADWQNVLAAAKKEGRVAVLTSVGAEARAALVQGLKNAYGINVEAVSGRTAEITARVLAERRAGLFLWDLHLGGTTSPLTEWKPAGILQSVEPTLILPDVTDTELIKKVWWQGKLFWIDDDHTLLASRMFPQPSLAINTNLVKPEEIKSYINLLDPKWKGRMTFSDPTVTGSSFTSALDRIMGRDWLRNLAKNEPIIMRDQRLVIDWLAHGKVGIGLAPKADLYFEFKRAGAPIQAITPAEGTWLTSGSGTICVFSRPAQPNAGKVFINWFMSKEGQTTYSKAFGGQSLREDVPTDFLASEEVRQPGIKYCITEQEEAIFEKAAMLKVAKEIFGHLVK